MEVARPPRSGPGCGILIGGFLLAGLSPAGWWWWDTRRQAEISSNERIARRVVEVLAHLEADFHAYDADKNGTQDFWTGDVAGLLAIMGPAGKSGVNASELARADPTRPDARPYHGYWFVPLKVDGSGAPRHPASFGFCAYPDRRGRSGRWVYLINESNSVIGSPDLDAPRRWPSDPELRRWSKPGS